MYVYEHVCVACCKACTQSAQLFKKKTDKDGNIRNSYALDLNNPKLREKASKEKAKHSKTEQVGMPRDLAECKYGGHSVTYTLG